MIAYRMRSAPPLTAQSPARPIVPVASSIPAPEQASPEITPLQKDAGPLVISGHVVSEKRNAIPGATLSLRSAELRHKITSGTDGAFSFPEIPSTDGFTLSVSAEGFVSQQIDVDTIPPKELTDLTIELKMGIVVTGVAVYPDGGPVVGLSVGLRREVPERNYSRRAITDGQGQFEIVEMSPGSWKFSLYRSLGAYQQLGPEIVLHEDMTPEPVRLVFTPPGMATIEGIVVDTSGAPIADVKVEAFTNETIAGWISGADGSFILHDLLDAVYIVRATKNEYQTVWIRDVKAPSDGVSITLPIVPQVVVRVVDAESQNPISTFGYLLEYSMTSVQQNAPYKLVDAPDGTLSIPIEMPGDFYFTVRAPGYCEAYTDTLSANDYSETGKVVVIPMMPCAVVRGRVLDPAGNGVAGALITTRPYSRFMVQEQRLTKTGKDGSFSIDTPSEGLSRLYAHHPAKGSGSYIGERGQPLPAEINIVLDTAATIAGEVTVNGVAPSAGEIVIQSERGETKRAVLLPTGKFEVAELAPGKYTVSAEGISDKSVFRVDRQDSVAIEAGERRTCSLAYRTGNLALRGKALYRDEPTRAAVSVFEYHSTKAIGKANADEQGAFALEHLEPGQYRVEGVLSRGASEQLVVRYVGLTTRDVNDLMFTWEEGGRVVVDTSALTNARHRVVALIDISQTILLPVSRDMVNEISGRDRPGVAAASFLKTIETSVSFSDVPAGEYQVLAFYVLESDPPRVSRTAEAFVTVTAGEEASVALAP